MGSVVELDFVSRGATDGVAREVRPARDIDPRIGRSRAHRAALYCEAKIGATRSLNDLTPGERKAMIDGAQWPRPRPLSSLNADELADFQSHTEWEGQRCEVIAFPRKGEQDTIPADEAQREVDAVRITTNRAPKYRSAQNTPTTA